MTMAVGTRLGPYEVLSPLGSGGMGEVYRARDTRLGRDVAIKVLHSDLSTDAEVRNRFEREARTISGLNHPNICTLFDVGRHGDIAYLVMELVDGETLGQRLVDGPLPTAEVLRIGAQIADALARAHRAHVIHRDLKPGNVMLTKSGAKLMDFGLARPVMQDGNRANQTKLDSATQSPTIAQPLTAEGTIVGTFQYMAPEQLAGHEADERSDLWALGCVLYEMATGKSAFEGKSQAHLIAAIMQLQPPPVTQLAPMTPPALDQLVRALLAKDPEDRIQTAHDVKLQLQWIAEGGSKANVPTPVAARRRLRERTGWGLAAVMFLVAAAFGWHAVAQRGAPTIAKRVTILPPEDANIDDDEMHTAVSPDGHAIVFVATDSTGTTELWLRDLVATEARPLPGTVQAYLPFWSPDARFVGFFADGKLKKVDVAGRNVETLCDAPDARGGTWSPRGVILFAPSSRSGLLRVSEAGGRVVQVTQPDSSRGERAHRFPSFLPDGVHFLFVALAGPESLATRIGSLESRKTTWVLNSDGASLYAAPGHLLFAHSGSLMVQAFDLRRGRLTGEPHVLGPAPRVSNYGGSPPASVSTNGIIVQRYRARPSFGLTWLDREGRRIGEVPITPGPYRGISVSPNGDRVALIRYREQGGSDVWTADLASGRANRLTDLPLAAKPVWSPDGRWIAFSSLIGTQRNIYRVLSGGTGEAEVYVPGKTAYAEADGWSRDGRTFLFRDLDPVTGEDVWARREDGDRQPYPLLHSRWHEDAPCFSPDGRWLAYRSNESGRAELYVQSFPSLELRARVSTGGAGSTHSDSDPGWREDGRELVWVGGDGVSVMSAVVETGAGLRIGAPRRLFMLPAGAVVSFPPVSDLKHFLILEPRNTREGSSVQMILDWPAELKH